MARAKTVGGPTRSEALRQVLREDRAHGLVELVGVAAGRRCSRWGADGYFSSVRFIRSITGLDLIESADLDQLTLILASAPKAAQGITGTFIQTVVALATGNHDAAADSRN